MATLTGKLVSQTYKALLKMIDNDILTETEKQISDGYGQGTGIFIDDNGFIRASSYRVTGGSSSQFLKGDGSLDSTGYLPVGTTTSAIAEGSRLYFTQARVLNTILTGFVSTEGTVTAADSILSAINKIWWNIENGGGGGGGYVPYTGATQNLNLGTYGLISDYLQFNLAPTSIPTTAGTMSWNAQDGTADLKMGGGNVTLQIGQEELVRVVNKTGVNLLEANYQAVRISGAQGNRLKVDLAKADNDANSADTIGIVTETINNNAEGFVTAVGLVRNIDTTGTLQGETWADGDPLYLSATTAGAITNEKPEAPEHGVRLGYVVRAHQTQGQIYVKVDNGYELDELHNVKITTPLDKDVLFYDGPNSLWINKNIYSAINATTVGRALLAIKNAADTTPVTTKPRGIRINVDNTVSAIEVGSQGYLPYYDATKFYADSPAWTDGTQVVIGDDAEFATGNKLSVVGNLAVDQAFGYFLGANRILFRNNTTGELRFGTTVANDFTTFYANGIERARLNASGYLGIGLTAPTQPLHVKGVLAYPKIIIDNNSTSGGGMFSAYQNGTESALFGVSGAWLLDNSSDAAIVATKAGQGIQFYTNGSTSEKMGINSDGNVFVGQTPTYFAGATHLIVRGKTGAGFLGVQHFDMSIRGSINTFNSVFQVGTSTFHAVAVIVEDIERARFNSAGRMLLGTTTDNTVDKLQIDGSLIATAIKKTGGTSSQFLKADGSVDSTAYGTGSVTSVSATVPTGFAISGSPITTSGTLAISFASGYSLPTNVKQSNWDDAYTFVTGFPTQTGNAGKYLTTDGSTLSWGTIVAGVSSFNSRTGAVTLVGSDVINALGYTPVTNARTITINGVTQDLSANITFNTGGVTSFNTRTGAVTLSSSDVTTALGFTPVTQARTLTINGQGYDLSADRAWTITPSSGMRNVTHYTATANQTTFTITGGYTVGLLDVFLNGVRIPESDFTATNGTTVVFTDGVKAGDIITAVLYTASATSGITGSGTANYLAKWSGTSAITNSIIFDNGTNVGIGTATPSEKLEISGSIRLSDGNADGPQLKLASSGFSDWNIDNLSGSLRAYYNASEFFRITSTGNVGIGTTSPLANLAINGINQIVDSFGLISVNTTNSQAANLGGQITLGGVVSGTSQTVFGAIAGRKETSTSGEFKGYLQFSTINGSVQERMRITSTGNVGIGTSSPVGEGSDDIVTHINNPATSGASRAMIRLTNNNTGTAWGNGSFITVDSSQGLYFGNLEAAPMYFFTSGSARLLINTNGDTEVRSGLKLNISRGDNARSLQLYTDNNACYIDAWEATSEPLHLRSMGSSGRVQFFTAGSERMRITSAGDLLISNTDGTGKIVVGGDDYAILLRSRNLSAGGPYQFYIQHSLGNVSIGNYRGSVSYNNASDYRLKEDLKSFNGIDILSAINFYDFKWKKSNERNYGIIAHEIQQVIPYLVDGKKDELNKDGSVKSQQVDYTKLIPVIGRAVQEINYKFETQAEKIARLETRVQQLEAK